MKNLTVNMPLAVPHQRPPSKYASHPYAFYAQENTQAEMVINSIGVERVLVELFLNEPIDYSLAVTDARLVQVYFEPRLIPNIALNNYSVNLGLNPPPLGSEVLLRQVYFPPIIVQTVGMERMNLSIEATGVLLIARYIPLEYTHYATQDDYYTNKLTVSSVDLRKII
ncbi:hypothetical protein ACTXMK_05415 [Psychrobacter celer]|uniref:hypothetical protein n=1 Tax=Psychrobacter celer TaxID=306572 RepID=UPI003FD06F08